MLKEADEQLEVLASFTLLELEQTLLDLRSERLKCYKRIKELDVDIAHVLGRITTRKDPPIYERFPQGKCPRCSQGKDAHTYDREWEEWDCP